MKPKPTRESSKVLIGTFWILTVRYATIASIPPFDSISYGRRTNSSETDHNVYQKSRHRTSRSPLLTMQWQNPEVDTGFEG